MPRSSAAVAVVGAIVVAAIAGWFFFMRGTAGANRRIALQIREDLRRRDMPDDAPWRDRRTQSLLRAFYAERRMQPAWTTGQGLNAQAKDLVDVLVHAADEGLNPDDYSAAELTVFFEKVQGSPLPPALTDPKALAEFDLLCTIAAFHYMSDIFDGRISPKALDAAWVAKPRKGDLDATLDQALRENRVMETLLGLAPTHEGYQKLRAARARLAAIVEAGGWQPIPPGSPLKKGQTGPRVQALRARLAATGDLNANAPANGAYDQAVEAAVRRIQERFGREPDGVLGATELSELNVPAVVRLRQIDLNMERWRWLPKTFGERYLIVNIPEYMLHLYEGGQSVLDMRVVVGKAMNATPIFSDRMEHVVVNPDWSIPTSIVKNEIMPALMEDPGYLAKNRIRVYRGSDEVDAESADWVDGSVSFKQDPGEGNALGRIKFMFPNSFDVYLHDTPAGHLFAKEERSFSHGCIRVEDPIQLAGHVLRGAPEADPATLQALIDAGETKTVNVPHPLPVHIVYFTAFVDEEGKLGFREDVYGIDQNLIEELRGRARAQARAKS